MFGCFRAWISIGRTDKKMMSIAATSMLTPALVRNSPA